MSDIVRRPRHENTLRAEIAEVLNVFSKAITAEDIAFSIARSVCNLTSARSVVYVAVVNGVDDNSPVAVGTYGSSAMFLDYEYWKATTAEGMNFGTFKSVAEALGWKDMDSEYVLEPNDRISEGSKLYCRKISDGYGIFLGYLCIESAFNPFEYSGFDDALLVMSIGALRYFQAQGKYGSHSVILQKIIHDFNGSMSVIGLQNELLKLKSNIENHFIEAQERIKSALKKADSSVRSLNEFSHLFFPDTADEISNFTASLPGIALNAAFSSLTLNPEQIAKIHVSNTVPEFDRVRVQGVVLYWIYRALLNAWAHPFLGGESKELEVFVDLKKTEGEGEFVDLSISRGNVKRRDVWLDMNEAPAYGAILNQVKLVPPVIILEKIINLFGGFLVIEKTDSARSMSIRFPIYKEQY